MPNIVCAYARGRDLHGYRGGPYRCFSIATAYLLARMQTPLRTPDRPACVGPAPYDPARDIYCCRLMPADAVGRTSKDSTTFSQHAGTLRFKTDGDALLWTTTAAPSFDYFVNAPPVR